MKTIRRIWDLLFPPVPKSRCPFEINGIRPPLMHARTGKRGDHMFLETFTTCEECRSRVCETWWVTPHQKWMCLSCANDQKEKCK